MFVLSRITSRSDADALRIFGTAARAFGHRVGAGSTDCSAPSRPGLVLWLSTSRITRGTIRISMLPSEVAPGQGFERHRVQQDIAVWQDELGAVEGRSSVSAASLGSRRANIRRKVRVGQLPLRPAEPWLFRAGVIIFRNFCNL